MTNQEPSGSQRRTHEGSTGPPDTERTCVIIKPHAVGQREKILRIYRMQGVAHSRWRVLTPSREVVEEHYDEHRAAEHFPTTVMSLCGRLIVLEFKGPDVIRRIRELNGATDPGKAAQGTIRQLFGGVLPFNAVHASSDREAAERELELWFDREKVVDTEPEADLPQLEA